MKIETNDQVVIIHDEGEEPEVDRSNEGESLGFSEKKELAKIFLEKYHPKLNHFKIENLAYEYVTEEEYCPICFAFEEKFEFCERCDDIRKTNKNEWIEKVNNSESCFVVKNRSYYISIALNPFYERRPKVIDLV